MVSTYASTKTEHKVLIDKRSLVEMLFDKVPADVAVSLSGADLDTIDVDLVVMEDTVEVSWTQVVSA